MMRAMLVNCVAYEDGRKLADIAVEDISDYVSRPGCFVWVALADPTDAELALMAQEFGLHELAVEDVKKGNQAPKIEEYGDTLFCVMRTVETSPPPDETLLEGQMAIFVGRNYVLSVRQNTQHGFVAVRTRTEHEPELLRRGAGYVFYALMDAVVDRYFPVLDLLESELETIEERLFAESSPRVNIEALYTLKNRLMVMRHAVAPLLESVSNLSGARVPPLCAALREYFRDIYDHLQRLNQTIESVRDSVSTATSVNLSMITLQENETMKRLAAYAALIAVPTMVAGIYGMNFHYMPELGWKYGYAAALGAMAVIDFYIFYRLRKARWL
jgi:magnesium transporter